METKGELAMKPGYEYFYDESNADDDDDVNSFEETEESIYTTVLTKTNERKKIPFMYSLGRRYHPVHEYDERKKYEGSLFWWTYRYDFPAINCITTDAGWGCMLRSAQMMLSHALRIHFKSRHWRPDPSTTKAREDDFVAGLMTWFADFPSKMESIYSLHNMCAAGMAKYEVLPGDWYGPGTACYVIRDLVALHQQRQSNLFRVHVSSEGTVYNDLVFELMTRDSSKKKRRSQQDGKEQRKVVEEPLHPLDPAYNPEKTELDLKEIEWDTGLLLLIPHRLGRDSLNEIYVKSVAQSFSLPQSVGILGGRPRGARWFYGAYADGSKVLGKRSARQPTNVDDVFANCSIFSLSLCCIHRRRNHIITILFSLTSQK
uniref:Cysteine protease n=1 Tax=Pseudo-nitzschia australis TaxID=44445 RepID=A0A7S4AEE5_9STRA